jgi:hypothetical protein
MPAHTVTLRFDGADDSEANKYAEELRRELREAIPTLTVERFRPDNTTQDFGATLVLVLGAPAMVAAVESLKAWLTRRNAASISIWTKHGKVIASGIESKDVPEIVKAIAKADE